MSNVHWLAQAADWQVSRWAVSYAVNALWQAPMVAAAAWAVGRLVKRAGPRAEHVVWVGALLVMIALPATPRRHWQTGPETATVQMGVSDVDLADLPPLQPVTPPLWDEALGLATLPRGLVLALLLGYLGAGMYFAVRLGWSLWRTRVLVREAAEISFEQDAEAAWERCREAFALGAVRRLASDDIACPVTVGRATVLVPTGFVEGAGSEELLTAMAHECAHVRRRDFWKNVAYELASLPVAFHPVLWMVKRQIAETREMVCDRAAVERVVAPGSYVRSLLRLAEGVVGPPAMTAAMGMFDGRTLERRIVSMRMRKARMGWAARCGVCAVAMAAGAAVVAGGMTLAVQVEAKAAPVSEPVVTAQTGDVDAASLTIAQPEAQTKAQAEAASTQAEAEDSGVSAAEHARRVAYANQHFGYGDVAGANSDRGRMYIRYGKPTDIESHPSGGIDIAGDGREVEVKYPFEVWRYQYLAGVGDNLRMEFVDECKCGEYHTAPMNGGAQAFVPGGPMVASVQPMRFFFQHDMSTEEQAKLQAQQAQIAELLKQQQDLMAKRQAFSAEDMAKLNQQLKVLQAQQPMTEEQLAKVREQLESVQGQLQGITAEQRQAFLEGFLAGQQRKLQEESAKVQAIGGVMGAGAPKSSASQQDPNMPVKVSGGVVAGTKIGGDEPVYPPIAKAAHVQGVVVLHAIISKEGTVSDLQVIAGPQMLQNAAIAAVRTWRYRPYMHNGETTAVDTTITVNFSMSGDSGSGDRGKPAAPPQGSNGGPAPAPAQVSGGVMAGSKIGGDDPAYPPIAKAAHVQGTVVLHAIISREGAVTALQVISGPQMLQNAAEEAVKTWRYKPFVVNGQPSEVETTITVNFTMNGDEPSAADAQAHAERMRQLYEQGMVSRETYELAAATALRAKLGRVFYAAPQGAQVEPGIYRIGGGVTAPRVLRSVEPEYTEEARRAKASGAVEVSLIVDREGRPQNVHVVHLANAPEPLGHGLEEKAVEAVKQYQFAPAMRDGQPVAVELSLEVDFQVF